MGCPLCVTGFPLADGFHFGTQSLGMISPSPCRLDDQWLSAIRRAIEIRRNLSHEEAAALLNEVDRLRAMRAPGQGDGR